MESLSESRRAKSQKQKILKVQNDESVLTLKTVLLGSHVLKDYFKISVFGILVFRDLFFEIRTLPINVVHLLYNQTIFFEY